MITIRKNKITDRLIAFDYDDLVVVDDDDVNVMILLFD